jgi:hypothetical protein
MTSGPIDVSSLNPELRILVLARVGRDAELLSTALDRHGFPSAVLSSVDDILREVTQGAAAAIVTEESLNGSGETWVRSLQAQPAWSDLPLIVLTTAGGTSLVGKSPLYSDYGNITLLERPLRSESLLSAVACASMKFGITYSARPNLRRLCVAPRSSRLPDAWQPPSRMKSTILWQLSPIFST